MEKGEGVTGGGGVAGVGGLQTQVPCCSSCRDTNRLSYGRTLPAEQSPTPILPGNCQPVISQGHSGPDASRIGRAVEHKQPGQFVPGSSREATAVVLCQCGSVCQHWCVL